ncbi:MAG: PAS domain S-box protein, partial [Ferruginibacter sp.]
MNSSAKLTFLVLVMTCFILGIGIYGVRELKIMNQNTETLYEDRVIPLGQLATLRYSYAMDILSVAQQANSSQLTFSQALQQIGEAEKKIHVKWKAYKLTYLTTDETALITQVEPLMAQGNNTISKLKDALNKKDAFRINTILNNELTTDIKSIVYKLNELVQLQIKVSGELHKNNKAVYSSTAKKLYISIAASLIFAFALSFLIVGDNRHLVNSLEASNRKIAASEEKWRAFIKYAGDAIFILDEKLRITEVNNSACKLLGYSSEELLQMKISDIIILKEQESVLEKEEIIKKQNSSLHERTLRKKDGSFVETEANVRELIGQGYVSIIRDITGRKRAELAIKDSDEKYRYLFDHNPAFVIVWNLENLQVLEVNNEVIEKYGYSRREWDHMSVLQYQPAKDHEKIKEYAREMLSGDGQNTRAIWQHFRKNGEAMQMEITSHKIIYNDRKAILSLGRDITGQLKAETELKKSEERHRALVENISDAITLINDRGKVQYRSSSVERINGYSFDDVKDMEILDVIHPDDHKHATDLLNQVYASPGVALEGQFRMLHKQGHYIWIEATLRNLFHLESVKALVINYRDITVRKEADLKFRNLVEKSMVGVYIIQKGKFAYVNPRLAEIFGYTQEELINTFA